MKAALEEVFHDPDIDQIAAADLAGDYPAIRYVPPAADYWIDILSRVGDAFGYPDVEYEVVRVEGLSVRVATPRMLYCLKRHTLRPQDRLDAQVIKDRFGLEDQ